MLLIQGYDICVELINISYGLMTTARFVAARTCAENQHSIAESPGFRKGEVSPDWVATGDSLINIVVVVGTVEWVNYLMLMRLC